MTYEEIVEQVRKAYADADAGKVKEHVAFQFNITGEGSGAFYLEVSDGKVNVEPYQYFDRDVLVTASADVILDIAEGRLDPVKAYLTGKLKAEGNLGKAAFLKELKGAEKSAKKTEAKETPAKKAEAKETKVSDVSETKAKSSAADKKGTVKAGRKTRAK